MKYVARTLYVKWRELLTMRLHSSYFRNSAYYKLNVLQDRLDNMWVWLCKRKGNLIRWFYHLGSNHQGLGRQNRQMGPWSLTFKSRGPFRKSMGHWSHGVGRMIGNKEMISTTIIFFYLWYRSSTVYFGLSTYFLHFISVSISQLQLMCTICNPGHCTCHSPMA